MGVPKVRIILPAYNQGGFIDEAIDSLKAQTFQDFEVILLDDGSNDGLTPQKLEKLNYSKITSKHLYKTNKGASARYNPFLQGNKNKYLMIFCGDDKLAPTFLEKCVGFLDSQKEYAAVSPYIKYFGAFDGIRKFEESKLILPDILYGDASYLGSCMMRCDMLDQIELVALKRQADFDRWISFLERGWKLGVITEPLFLYRQVETSQWHTNTSEIELEVKGMIYSKHKDTFQQYGKELYLHFIGSLWDKGNELRDKQVELNKAWERNEELGQEISKISNSTRYKIGGAFTKPYRIVKKLFLKE
jgi:glycosyltransferase involved in cell wall biosynthesis